METPIFKHSLPIQVRLSDIDLLGHVSNTIYQNYYDCGKLGYFDEVFGEMDWQKLAVVAASIKLDYLIPIYIKSHVQVESRISKIGNKSITFEQRIIDQEKNILSTCTTVMVCYLTQEKQSIAVPELWRKNIAAYEGV
jgi:acyl-CoA thioester hydrolase